ncbi:hypothetical protein [Streptococcus sp. FT1-106]|uniref:hypothetical protein n=1 Tax=unclassified Streptococcus TaxID=2608887 RepID=UPI003BF4F30E
MKKLLQILPYLILPILSFWSAQVYLLLTMLGILSYDDMIYKNCLVSSILFFNPLVVASISFIYALINGVNWLFPIVIIFSFLPTMGYYYFFTNSAGIEVYLLIYSLLSLFALCVGGFIHSYHQKKAKKS